ncbi:MAG: hypothetical protein WAV31_01260 [Candidatus Moraniibacteriota bacterium]
MNIERKIEEIRKKPEHIRIRYIYGLIAISMFFILLLWFFSFFSANIYEDPATKLKNEQIMRDFQAQKKSLEDVTKNTKDAIDNLNNTIPPESNQLEESFSNEISPQNDQSSSEIRPQESQTPNEILPPK